MRLVNAQDHLLSLLTAPVLDVSVNDDNPLELPDSSQLKNYAPPDAADSFIMVLRRFDGMHWGFTRQTYGDFFLVNHKKVFRLTGKSHDIWMPLSPTQSYPEFIELLKHEIKKRLNTGDMERNNK